MRQIFNNNGCEGKYLNDMMVISTEKCCYNCSFCIAKDNNKTFDETNVDKMIDSIKKEKPRNIMIQGGEALIELDNLLDFIKGVKPLVENIYLTTALPKVEEDELYELIELIDHMTVSMHHYSHKINNDILREKDGFYNRFVAINNLTKYYSDKITISCNMVKGYMDTKKDIQLFINKMHELGVKNIKFTELQGEPDLFVKFEDAIDYKLNDAYVYGCNQDITETISNLNIEAYDINIRLKRVCFLVEEMATSSYLGLFKYFTYFFKNVTFAFRKRVLKQNISPKYNKVLYNNGEVLKDFK